MKPITKSIEAEPIVSNLIEQYQQSTLGEYDKANQIMTHSIMITTGPVAVYPLHNNAGQNGATP